MNTNRHEWNFEKLVGTIRQLHKELAAQAGRAVNISLTLRNWLIGAYISEFELRGSDRGNYGDRLLSELSRELRSSKQQYRLTSKGRQVLSRTKKITSDQVALQVGYAQRRTWSVDM